MKKVIIIFIGLITLYSCADYKVNNKTQKNERKYFSSNGFALIYENELFLQNVVNKKINNEDIRVMHSQLKINTPLKIINPVNSKSVETKVFKRAKYPKIFNVVISKKIALILELDLNDPYVEIFEIKKNKVFVAKKTNTEAEEKNVAEKAPVDEVNMDDLSKEKSETEEKILKDNKFILVINDFYFEDSAVDLKMKLRKKTKINNIYVRKINNKKYRLFAGPFKNFNALKTTYISLNNLGFENLDINKE